MEINLSKLMTLLICTYGGRHGGLPLQNIEKFKWHCHPKFY